MKQNQVKIFIICKREKKMYNNLYDMVFQFFVFYHYYIKGMDSQWVTNLFIEPSDMSGRNIAGKTFIGLVIGMIISFVIFMIVALLWWEQFVVNPLLPLVLVLIAFLSTFVGNITVAAAYSLLFGRTYYDVSKMMILILWSNVLLFMVLVPLYMIFNAAWAPDRLFYVLAFHVVFSIFMSSVLIETSKNPNYAWSALIGSMIGLMVCVVIYGMVAALYDTWTISDQQYVLMLIPAICGYTVMPLCTSIRDVIYYKLYEMGSNPFYIPSLSEVMVPESESNISNEDVNISL